MLPRQPIKLRDFDKRRIIHGGLLNKHFCKNKIQISPMTQQKLSIYYFSHKSMETISCHSNQSSYPTGTFHSPTYRCYVSNMEHISLTVSEVFTDGQTTGGRTPDACIYYKLTYEPSAQVSSKLHKKE